MRLHPPCASRNRQNDRFFHSVYVEERSTPANTSIKKSDYKTKSRVFMKHISMENSQLIKTICPENVFCVLIEYFYVRFCAHAPCS